MSVAVPARTGVTVAPSKTHAEHVELLALHVRGAHVDDALEAEARAHGRGGDAVLPRARLRDDALLPHSLREEGLADGVVDLVRARVVQVLALEVDVRGAVELREALSAKYSGFARPT